MREPVATTPFPSSTYRRRGPKTGLVVLLGLAAAACLSTEDPDSVWPPEDFYLELEAQTPATGGGMQVAQRFQVWSDGLALYRTATDSLGGPEQRVELPVFRRLCAFQMKPESTRMLARTLHLRGVLDLDAVQGDERDYPDHREADALGMVYRGFGETQTVMAQGEIRGAMVSVLRAANSFLPPGEEFTLPGMRGGREPSRLDGLPTPRDDLEGALDFHQELLKRFPDDSPMMYDMMVDTFVLACVLERRPLAEQLLSELQVWLGSGEEMPFSDGVAPITADTLRGLLDGR